MKLARSNLLIILIIILLVLAVSLVVSFYWLYSLYEILGLYGGLFIYAIAIGAILVVFRDALPKKIKCEICGSVMRKHETKKDTYVCNHCGKEFKI